MSEIVKYVTTDGLELELTPRKVIEELVSAKDRGDIAGVRLRGERVVIECKDYGGQHKLPEWLKEAEAERGNDDAAYGVVAWKRRGTADPAEQFVTMTARTFAAIVAGGPGLLEEGEQ